MVKAIDDLIAAFQEWTPGTPPARQGKTLLFRVVEGLSARPTTSTPPKSRVAPDRPLLRSPSWPPQPDHAAPPAGWVHTELGRLDSSQRHPPPPERQPLVLKTSEAMPAVLMSSRAGRTMLDHLSGPAVASLAGEAAAPARDLAPGTGQRPSPAGDSPRAASLAPFARPRLPMSPHPLPPEGGPGFGSSYELPSFSEPGEVLTETIAQVVAEMLSRHLGQMLGPGGPFGP